MPPKLSGSVTICNAREGSAGADPGIQERGPEPITGVWGPMTLKEHFLLSGSSFLSNIPHCPIPDEATDH